ncbi:hypothetical protein FOXG_18755 [Fusarium oxysporum f. sp. lycopersici 4287]|uniref:Uncharacterized protein n=2 Tax=Fusarium oxysporum TaxID=5507 RepID=A0A0J9UMD7_FUSO4|nr:hypothetical protein FOXG_18755 [Fusarium oxysporum f. sp. lycopersici 4287]EXK44294.1 hypothetical protein FOMG_03042 [Fusarium oxysporum f. sp. melonis 26406]KNB00639.1 hypothetical protein FOXG_18755 [Fusarium oxysporum f. sp. lycopersici 4287]
MSNGPGSGMWMCLWMQEPPRAQSPSDWFRHNF